MNFGIVTALEGNAPGLGIRSELSMVNIWAIFGPETVALRNDSQGMQTRVDLNPCPEITSQKIRSIPGIKGILSSDDMATNLWTIPS